MGPGPHRGLHGGTGIIVQHQDHPAFRKRLATEFDPGLNPPHQPPNPLPHRDPPFQNGPGQGILFPFHGADEKRLYDSLEFRKGHRPGDLRRKAPGILFPLAHRAIVSHHRLKYRNSEPAKDLYPGGGNRRIRKVLLAGTSQEEKDEFDQGFYSGKPVGQKKLSYRLPGPSLPRLSSFTL